jgi:hypothetical protein
MRITFLFLASCLVACSACEDKPTDASSAANGSTPTTGGGSATATPGCPPAHTPDDWHTVDSLFVAMDGVNGKTVADLFVGDGYYTMKLLEAGARVIAMDDDPRNIEALQAKKEELGICDERLIIRNGTPGTPNLSLNEVDIALCTRQLLSIPDPVGYFTKVRSCIRFPSNLFLVQFLPEQTPVGPPLDERLPEDRVMDAMEPCGFTDIGSYSKKMPYRYMVHALMFSGESGEVETMMQEGGQPQ